MFIKVLLAAVFFAVTAAVGVYCRRHAGNVGDFVLGGRNVGPWVTAFAYGTSYFSSVVFVGYAGQFGWNFGVSAVWIGIGNALVGSLLAWKVLGRRTRVMTKHLEAATMPDFFGKRYMSPAMKTASSVIIFVFLVPYSASVYKGLSELFAMAFGVDFIWCAAGIAVLTALYVVLGGYMAAALNDFLQGIIMAAGIAAVVFSVLNGRGGFTAAMRQLSEIESPAQPELSGAFVSFFGPDPPGLLTVVLLTSLGAWVLPQMVHKFYTIRDDRAVQTGAAVSAAFALVIAGGSYFMGAFSRLYVSAEGTPEYDSIVPSMLSQNLPDALIGVVLILVLSASMSTLSSLVITSGSAFVLDFAGRFRRGSGGQVRAIKAVCAVFVLISAVIALNPGSLITALMSLSWGALSGSFLGPFLWGLYWKGTTRAGVWASFAAGTGINVLNLALGLTTATAAGALSMLVSLAVVPLVSLVTAKLPERHLSGVFACFDGPDGTRSRAGPGGGGSAAPARRRFSGAG